MSIIIQAHALHNLNNFIRKNRIYIERSEIVSQGIWLNFTARFIFFQRLKLWFKPGL